MKPSSQSPRTPSRLSDSVHRQLNMYAFAASAAGVGVIALAQPAQAKVIYTKTRYLIEHKNPPYNLDLNHDGVVDFKFSVTAFGSTYVQYWGVGVFPNGRRNRIQGRHACGSGWVLAAALETGARVGPSSLLFCGHTAVMLESYRHCGFGSWENVTNDYLGLKFMVKGKIHYGWARMSARCRIGRVTARITGYAYETIPNKPIIAGRTKGPDVIALEPGSLGALAAGSAGLAPRR